MKTNKLKIALAAAMFISACFSSFAQDVDGISLWDKYTKEQLIQRYGQPVSYRSQEGDSPEDGLIETIKFNNVQFYLVNSQVAGFLLVSNKVSALTKTIEGGIKIGDDASVLNPIKDKNYLTRPGKNGIMEYHYLLNPDWDDTFSIGLKDNIIVEIGAHARLY